MLDYVIVHVFMWVCKARITVTPMYAEERQQVILERARVKGRVDVAALAEEFVVTTETIRRDLTVLERHGVLRRVHGGAIPVERLGFEPTLSVRETVMTEEKERIARAALAELPEAGTILLDAGSTTARLADALPVDRELTVVTHSVNIALTLITRPNVTVMLVGGRLRSKTLASVDAWALQALRDTFVDVAFIATNGISVERGLTTPDPAEAMVKKAAIAAGRRCVLLADHTKVGNDHFARFADLGDIDTFITDKDIDDEVAAEIATAGPKVITT
jgi:DeoR family fructose operon transcriptional repressor